MDEGAAASETVPDLRDVEVKIGRKTPEGLLKWMREEASSPRGDAKLSAAHDSSQETGMKSLDEKIRKLRVEMAHLRSADVKILQQLLAVHEGIEAVKWLLEERGTLTSRCSSLTSSQYSLGEGPDTSWRGSWSSLQDPNDKLDNVSIGSYLDTLADEMDEFCPSSSESVICSAAPLVSESTAGGQKGAGARATVASAETGPGVGVRSSSGPGSVSQTGANENGTGAEYGTGVKGGVTSAIPETGIIGNETGKPAAPVTSPKAKSEGPKQDDPVCTKAARTGKGSPVCKGNTQTQGAKSNGVVEKTTVQTGSPARPNLKVKQGMTRSPELKPFTNGKVDVDTCKMNGKVRVEYDVHWKWVQSQEDVTFL